MHLKIKLFDVLQLWSFFHVQEKRNYGLLDRVDGWRQDGGGGF